MKSVRSLIPWTLVLLLVAAQGEVVDRTIAVVNRHVVTWSDLDTQMRFEALENGRALQDVGNAERYAAFDRLVQYCILRDQMQNTTSASSAEVDARVAELRAGWKMERDSVKWEATLARYGLSSADLRELVTNQIEIMSFMEFRVRPLVRVSRKEVEDYYSTTLAPQAMAIGQDPGSVEQMTPKIRELLAEQKINREMERWLGTLRAQSSIQILWDGVR